MGQSIGRDLPASRLERALTAIILFVALDLWLAMAFPLFIGKVYSSADLWSFYLPDREFYAQCLSRHESPLWFPGVFCGFYLHGAGSVGMCHPLHLLLYSLLPLSVAFDLEVLLPYPIMFLGSYLFFRRLEIRPSAAAFGALLLAFSTFNIARLNAPNAVLIVAHIPYLLTLLDILVRGTWRASLWSALGIVVLNASELLLGYPQYFWFSCLACGCYLVYLFWDRALGWSRLALFVLASAVGVAGGGIQLLPTFDANSSSFRTLSSEWNAENRNAGSTEPLYLLQMFSGYSINPSHKQRPYAGAAPLLLFLWTLAVFRGTPNRRRLIWTATGLVLLGTALCLGKYGGIYRLQAFLPIIGTFRFPSRYVHLVSLGYTLVAVLGFGLLCKQSDRTLQIANRWRGDVVLILSVLFSLGVTALAFVKHSEQARLYPVRTALGFVLMLVVALLIAAAARGWRWALLLLPVLAALDAGYYGIGYAVWDANDNYQTRLTADDFPPQNSGTRLLGGDYASTMVGWPRADGIDGLIPYQQLKYDSLSALRAASIAWIFDERQLPTGDTVELAKTPLFTDLPVAHGRWREITDPRPFVYCVSRAVVSRDPGADIQNYDVATTALVSEATPLDEGATGEVQLIERQPASITLDTTTSGRQLLVVSESFHPGWTVQIDDGDLQPPRRVNGDFMGCLLSAGKHRVTLRFAPTSFMRGALLSAIVAAVCLLGALFLSLWPSSQPKADG